MRAETPRGLSLPSELAGRFQKNTSLPVTYHYLQKKNCTQPFLPLLALLGFIVPTLQANTEPVPVQWLLLQRPGLIRPFPQPTEVAMTISPFGRQGNLSLLFHESAGTRWVYLPDSLNSTTIHPASELIMFCPCPHPCPPITCPVFPPIPLHSCYVHSLCFPHHTWIPR